MFNFIERQRKSEQSKGESSSEHTKATSEKPATDKSSSESWKGKGTVAQKPKEKKDGHETVATLRELSVDEIDQRTIIDLMPEELQIVSKPTWPEEINFIYDTGSEKGGITIDKAGDVLQNIHQDEVSIVGQGGAIQKVDKAGYNTFGLFRVLKQEGNVCVISHSQAEKYWRLHHVAPRHLQLREWKHKTGKVWDMYIDKELYGDELPHLVVTRDDLPHLFRDIESQYSVYQPKDIPSWENLSQEQVDSIVKVNRFHIIMGHLSAQAIIRIIKSEESDLRIDPIDITIQEVLLWDEYEGKHCSGCLQGKMKEHNRVKSKKKEDPSKVHGAGTGDLMFIDQPRGAKKPLALHVDYDTKYIIGYPLSSKSTESLQEAYLVIKGIYASNHNELNSITYDRESALMAMSGWLNQNGITVIEKAAGQHSGVAEVTISLIRSHARATKASVYDRLGYRPLPHWNIHLVQDVITVLNHQVRTIDDFSATRRFCGYELDYFRDIRVAWGDIVVIKKRKDLASNLSEVAGWGVIVRRWMNGTGLFLAWMVSTKRYRHGFKFGRAKVPNRIIDEINEINPEDSFGFEDDDSDAPSFVFDIGEQGVPLSQVDSISYDSDIDEETNVDTLIDQAIDLSATIEEQDEARRELEDIYVGEIQQDFEPIMDEEIAPIAEELVQRRPRAPTTANWEEYKLYRAEKLRKPTAQEAQERGLRRSPRLLEMSNVVKKMRAIEFMKRSVVVIPRLRLDSSFVLYEQALKTPRKDEAIKALDKELDSMENKCVWKGILQESLSKEQQGLIIDGMVNFIEKFHPTGEFDKSKARVLFRGDQQTLIGESESPVCRVESVFLVANIACVLGLNKFKMDFTSAFLNSPMVDDVKHKWLLLPRSVSRRLLERDPNYWRPYLRTDGKVLVELNKVMYGAHEAALQWFLNVSLMFEEVGYHDTVKDPCFFWKRGKDNDIILIALTVDDSFGADTPGSGLREELLAAATKTFGLYTIEEGEEINVIGMHFSFNREEKSVRITQKHFVTELIKDRNVTKKARAPSGDDLFDVDDDSPLLSDQKDFMSVNASLNYAGTRTYPELLPVSTTLASRYYKATEQDLKKAHRAVEYLNQTQENHCLFLRPKSFNIIAYADASYGERVTGHSQTGGCVGFEGFSSPSFFIFTSQKQPVVAKSSCEAELIAANTVADGVVWLQETLLMLGLQGDQTPILFQDNQSSIVISEKGRGTFKRTKHIKVRYFWIKEIIDSGWLTLKFIGTDEMIADVLTKPIGGTNFRYLVNPLLGWNNMPEDV